MKTFLKASRKVIIWSLSIVMILSQFVFLNNTTVRAIATDENNFMDTNIFRAVSTGDSQTVAVDQNNTLWAWGTNLSGEIGNGTTVDQPVPIKILDNVKFALATNTATFNTTYAIKTDGSLWGWGSNMYGNLGDGTIIDKLSPIKIMDDVLSIQFNINLYIIKKDGSLWVCGEDGVYAGTNTTGIITSPVKILDNVKNVCLGSMSYAIENDNSAWRWGVDDTTYWSGSINYKTPQKFMDNVRSVTTNGFSTLVVKCNNELWGWGSNSNGQLGDNPTFLATPTLLFTDGVKEAFFGSDCTYILGVDDNLYGMGSNDLGQLGDGTLTDSYDPVEIVTGVKKFIHNGNSWVINNDNVLMGWGINNFYLGTSTSGIITKPIPILNNVKDFSIGRTYVAVMTDGTLKGWLGDTGSKTPVNILTDTFEIKTDISNIAIPQNISGTIKLQDDVSNSGKTITYSIINSSGDPITLSNNGIIQTKGDSTSLIRAYVNGVSYKDFTIKVCDPIISFKDQNLEKALLDKSINNVDTDGNGVITRSEIRSAETINLDDCDISDLSGIENAISVTSLSIESNHVSDLTPLNGLINLQYLSLYNNNISNIDVTSNFSDLGWLDVGKNNITDISPLSLAKNLSYLSINDNQVSDVSPIFGISNLYELDWSGNNISDINQVSGLVNLGVLLINHNNLTDVSSLISLTNLTEVDVEYNYINLASGSSEINIINTLISDNTTVDYSNQKFGDYQNMNDDVSLDNNLRQALIDDGFDYNKDGQLSQGELSNIDTLDLSNKNITNLSGLQYANGLYDINLSGNMITDFSPLYNAKELLNLNVSNNNLTDISFIKNFVMAKTGYKIPDEDSTMYFNLDISNNRISNIYSLIGLHFSTLNLSDNNITDITVASNLFLNDSYIGQVLDVSNNFIDISQGSTGKTAIDNLINEKNVDVIYEPQKINNISGVEDGKVYNGNVTITITEGDATLNGIPFISGSTVSLVGTYTLIVTDSSENPITIVFSISNIKKGDVNGDGNITSADALMVLKYAAGKIKLSDSQIQAADVNSSGTVTSADALEILKYAAGKIKSF